MKLCVSTLGCVDYSLEQALKLVQDYSLDGIEVRGMSGFVQNAEIPEFAEDRIAETAARINAVTVPAALDTSIRCDAMEETDEALDEFRNDLRIAVAVGFPYLRVFGNNLKDPDNEAEYEHIAFELRRMSELAAEQGSGVFVVCAKIEEEIAELEEDEKRRLTDDQLLIPNMPIHFNREVNTGYNFDAQRDMMALYGEGGAAGGLMREIAEAAGTEPEQILGHDLFLYSRQSAASGERTTRFSPADELTTSNARLRR